LNRGLDGKFGLEDFQDGEILTFEPSGFDKKIKFHLYKPSREINSYIENKGSLEYLLGLDLLSINGYLSSIGMPPITLDQIIDMFKAKSAKDYREWPLGYSSLIGIFVYYYDVIINIILDAQRRSTSSKTKKINLEDVLNLPEFKEIEKLGFYSTTTPAIWKNGNIRFTHPFLKFRDVLDTVTIYQGGPVRLTSSSRPALVTAAPGFTLNTKEDWAKKITWVNSYLKRKILKDKFGITSKKEQESLASLNSEDFLMKLFEIGGEKFDNFLQEILDSPQAKVGILESKDLIKKMITQDPEKTARTFKEFYQRKEIEDAVKDLPQKTQDEFKFALGILGDLNQLGF
jgi:hypothetical protein